MSMSFTNIFACMNHSALGMKKMHMLIWNRTANPKLLQSAVERQWRSFLSVAEVIANLWCLQTWFMGPMQNPKEDGLDEPFLTLSSSLQVLKIFIPNQGSAHLCFQEVVSISKLYRSVSCHVNDKLNVREHLQKGKHLPDDANFFRNSPPCSWSDKRKG